MPITSLIFSENNPAGVKSVLEALGISSARVRLPLVEASNILKEKITLELNVLSKR